MPTVEVFAEIGCPFTHLGLRRFVERRAESRRTDVRIRVRAWPLELVNGEALDPHLVDEEIAELRAQVAPDLFRGFDPSRFPASSLGAMALAHAAYAKDLALGEAVSLAIRDRLFEQGDDVADPVVLASLAAEFGIAYDPAATTGVTADYEEGVARGVVGSPHFFTPAGSFFCPTLEITRVDDRLHIKTDPAGFDRFVDSCLGE